MKLISNEIDDQLSLEGYVITNLNANKNSHLMITIGMNYEVFPDKEKLFTIKFKEVMDLLNETKYHHTTKLYKDAYSSTPSFLVVSEWETRDAFLSFIKSDIFRQTTDWGKAGILSDRPRHKVYQTEKLEKQESNN